jgi:hypothetical protein
MLPCRNTLPSERLHLYDRQSMRTAPFQNFHLTLHLKCDIMNDRFDEGAMLVMLSTYISAMNTERRQTVHYRIERAFVLCLGR